MTDLITTNPDLVRGIDIEQMPFLVLSDNLHSLVSAEIKSHEQGCYNHLMWMITPGYFISQDFLFHRVDIEKYLQWHRLKFWHNPNWSKVERFLIIGTIVKDLRLPWYKRLYDPLQIVGKKIGCDWLQIPGSCKICSDRADYLWLADQEYDLYHPSPAEVNRWLTASEKYKVFMRYLPD